MLASSHMFRLFDIESLNSIEAEKNRGINNDPTLKLGKSDLSSKLVILNVTSIF